MHMHGLSWVVGGWPDNDLRQPAVTHTGTRSWLAVTQHAARSTQITLAS